MMDDPRLPDRFWSRVTPEPTTGCWLWFGACSTNGYGTFRFQNRTVRTHRHCFQVLVAPVPRELQLDHLCRTRNCVNPAHLEPVTAAENVRRGNLPALTADRNRARAKLVVRCPRGHEYAGLNVRITLAGTRRCRACGREKWHERKARRR